MNHWAMMLAELPASLQRLIARTGRISLPRNCSPDQRVARLRMALCHARTVRVTYAMLDATVQAALQDLRTRRGGLSLEALTQRYGPLRSWRQMLDDPHPQTLSEQLVLMGWLLPRPARPNCAPRYLLPPELRRWLPQPLRLTSLGAAPLPPLPAALRAAATLLVSCAEAPLACCADGRLRRASLRRLVPRLAPLPEAEAGALCQFMVPLLTELGLIAREHDGWTLAPAGQRFLDRQPACRRDQLYQAWLSVAPPDRCLAPMIPDAHIIDWFVLRRRLGAWSMALPPGQVFDPATLYPALAATFGPLGDADTHSFGWKGRVPWQPRRAEAIFTAALEGPLAWLGLVAWHAQLPATDVSPAAHADPERRLFRPDTTAYDTGVFAPERATWHYGAPGELIIPHTGMHAALVRLLPFVAWHAADADATCYRVTAATLAQAAGQGYCATHFWELLAQHVGTPPADWRAGLEAAPATLEIRRQAVVVASPPALLDRAAQQRSVRRYLDARLAPGVALVEPERVAALARALGRQNVAVQIEPLPVPPRAADLGPGDYAALLVACAFYRQHAPPTAPLLPGDRLEERLRRALPRKLRLATEAALSDLGVTLPPLPEGIPWEPFRPAPAEARLVEISGAVSATDDTAITGEEERSSSAGPAERPPVAAAQYLPPEVTPAADDDTDAVARMPQAAVLTRLRRAIADCQAVEISYNTAENGTWTSRIIRPLSLEQRYGEWYLHAYCTLRKAERVFRVDRIGALKG
jgi:hypothetical protein